MPVLLNDCWCATCALCIPPHLFPAPDGIVVVTDPIVTWRYFNDPFDCYGIGAGGPVRPWYHGDIERSHLWRIFAQWPVWQWLANTPVVTPHLYFDTTGHIYIVIGIVFVADRIWLTVNSPDVLSSIDCVPISIVVVAWRDWWPVTAPLRWVWCICWYLTTMTFIRIYITWWPIYIVVDDDDVLNICWRYGTVTLTPITHSIGPVTTFTFPYPSIKAFYGLPGHWVNPVPLRSVFHLDQFDVVILSSGDGEPHVLTWWRTTFVTKNNLRWRQWPVTLLLVHLWPWWR